MKRLSRLCAAIFAVIFAIILISCSTGPATTEEPLFLQIKSPEDNTKLDTNLLKVSGTVSNFGATVLVNGAKAKVEKDGSFSAYVELSEGKNTIEAVATLADKKATQAVTVTFSPRLVIFLDKPRPEQGVDYTQTPLKISGSVSDPEAKVTLGGSQVEVEKDGSFSTRIQLKEGSNSGEIVAVLGEKKDSMRYIITLTPEGQLVNPPPMYGSRLDYSSSLTLTAGETKSLDITLQVGSYIRSPADFRQRIFRVSKEYGENEFPPPEGIEVSIEPSRFKVYPMTIYHSTMTIKAAPDLAPAVYFFKLETFLIDAKWMVGWIKVTVGQ